MVTTEPPGYPCAYCKERLLDFDQVIEPGACPDSPTGYHFLTFDGLKEIKEPTDGN
ncbi:hypothetical protein LCGC14_0378680 [marine sediment metagenome]|uniref:Uncharacterized protein n=1 Tax=marine sediment metagenome TaxID=412755 RepID=A0A0F9T2V9_9ZZZZ